MYWARLSWLLASVARTESEDFSMSAQRRERRQVVPHPKLFRSLSADQFLAELGNPARRLW